MHGNGRDAPIPDLPALAPERGGSTLSRPFGENARLSDTPNTATGNLQAREGISLAFQRFP